MVGVLDEEYKQRQVVNRLKVRTRILG